MFVVAAAGGTCAARADLAHVEYTIKFADPELTPGEKQTIEVWWNFVGESVGPLGKPLAGAGNQKASYEVTLQYRGIGTAAFTLRNQGGAQSGTYGEQWFNPNFLTWGAGTINQHYDIEQVSAYLFPWFPWSITQNPALIWRVDWTPTDYTPRVVSLETDTPWTSVVWVNLVNSYGWPTGPNGLWDFPSSGEVASFKVVPAPGVMSLGVAVGLTLSRRRRTAR